MKKAPIIAISLVVVLALIALGIYLAGQRQQPTTTPSTMPNTSQPSSSQPPSQSQGQNQNTQQATSNEVSIQNFSFSPASLTVKKGTTVTWTNHDDIAHTVIESDNKVGPGSSLLAKDQTYSFTYNEIGTFAYKCSVHPSMTGSVTVTE